MKLDSDFVGFSDGRVLSSEFLRWTIVVACRRCRSSVVVDDTKISVLVVDDDEVDREAVRRALRGLEVEVVECESASNALARLKSLTGTPVLVLADINMPGMSGFEMLDSLRDDADIAATVVFMLTSSSRDVDRREAYRRHVAGYLIKGELGDRLGHLTALLSAYSASVRLP